MVLHHTFFISIKTLFYRDFSVDKRGCFVASEERLW